MSYSSGSPDPSRGVSRGQSRVHSDDGDPAVNNSASVNFNNNFNGFNTYEASQYSGNSFDSGEERISVVSDNEVINPFDESSLQVHTKNPLLSNQERISSLPKLNVRNADVSNGKEKLVSAASTSYDNPLSPRSYQEGDEGNKFSYLNVYLPYFRNSSTFNHSQGSFISSAVDASDLTYDEELHDDNGKSKISPKKQRLLLHPSPQRSDNNALERKRSLFLEALEDEDLPAIHDGFKEALGSRTSMGLWLPLDKDKKEDQSSLPQRSPDRVNRDNNSNQIVVQGYDNDHDDDVGAGEQPRGAIKMQNLPIATKKNDPSIELLSPSYLVHSRPNSGETGFTPNLEEGLRPPNNDSSFSVNSSNSELKRHLTTAFHKFSQRIVHGNESDANIKRLSQASNANISILNDENGVSDLSRTAEVNEQQQLQQPTLEVTGIPLDLPRVPKITSPNHSVYSRSSFSAENISAPESAFDNSKANETLQDKSFKDEKLLPNEVHVQNLSADSGETTYEYQNPDDKIEELRNAHIYDRESGIYNRKLGIYGNSLKYFDPFNPFRVALARMLFAIPDVFFLAIYIIHGCTLAYQEWNPPKTGGYYYSPRFGPVDAILLSANVIFTIEIVAKIISFGFFDNSDFYREFNLDKKDTLIEKLVKWVKNLSLNNKQRQKVENESKLKHSFTIKPTIMLTKSELDNLKDPFLRNNWNVLDFISCIAYWVSLLLSIRRTDVTHHLFVFRALACIRIFRLARLTEGTFTILRSLEHALPQLTNICLFMLYFWMLFSIAGVQTFKSSFKRQCVWIDPMNSTNTYVDTDDYQFCGAWLDPDSGVAQPYVYSDGRASNSTKGYYCPRNSKCISDENPYGGTVSFDNIFHSMELVYVVMSMNTFTDLMYYTMDAENMAGSIFFVVCIFLMTIWLMNIFVAVIVSSFKITSEIENPNKTKKSKSIFDYILFTHLRTHGLPFKIASRVEKYRRFETIWVLFIAADMIVQAFRRADSSEKAVKVIDFIGLVVTYVLLLEIIARFFVFLPYWRYFLCYKRNQFDLVLAIITSVIMVPAVRESLGQMYYWLTVFQICRFYRVVVAVRFVQELWLKVIGNFKTIGNLTLFYFLLLFLYSIVTSAYFEGVIDKELMEDDGLLFGMNTLPNTFLALYVITSTENWTDVLYALQQYSKSSFSRAIGAILIIGWFIFSNSIILNIFIAVIAENLEVSEHEKKKQQVRSFVRNLAKRLTALPEESFLENAKRKLRLRRTGRSNITKNKADVAELFGLLMTGTIVDSFLEDEKKQIEMKGQEKKVYQLTILYNNPVSKNMRKFFKKSTQFFTSNPFYAKRQVDIENTINPNVLAKNILMEDKIMAAHQRRYLENNPNFNRVLYIFAPRNRLRRFCQMFVNPSVGERVDGRAPDRRLQELFNFVMLAGTVGLVVLACYATPLYTHSHNVDNKIWFWTLYSDLAFVLLFTIEAVVKIIADGFLFTPNAVFRSSWNIIDITVLNTLWLNFIFSLKGNGNGSRIVRGIKALRALRLLTISETAKKTFHQIIIAGFGKIMGAAAVSFCLLFPFSIWGLNIFNGRLGVCNDNDLGMSDCHGEFTNQVFNWDVVSPRVYQNPYLFFDSFPHSFSSLFQISSLEGWVDLLEYVTQSTGKGTPISPYAQPYNAVFLVIYMFLAIIFILNLFVSVIISNYAQTSGSAYLTNEQRSWNEVEKLLKQVTPTKRPKKETLGSIKLFCYNLVIEKNKKWQLTYDIMLAIHLVMLLMESSENSKQVETFRNVIVLFGNIFFFADSLLKAFVKGFNSLLFKNKWDMFQFVVTMFAFVYHIVFMHSPNAPVIPNVAKAFSLCIIMFIIQRSNRLSLLLKFASASLPSLLSLLYTWFILFMVYAIALNQIFGLTKIGENGSGNMNVRTVTKSLILLFKMSFGEGWNEIMNDYYVNLPYCYTTDTYSDCGNSVYAHILFISWNVVSMFIFLNLFISLVVENFSYVYHRTGPCSLITRQEIRKFKHSWMKYDPDGTGYIPLENFYEFLHSLDGVLSFKLYDGRLSIKNLSQDWFTKADNDDPYDFYIDRQAMKATLDSIDVKKVRHRKSQFERFVEEAILDMEMNDFPGISFTKVLMQIPLYTQFQDGACLSLSDYLERHLLLQKLDKRISKKKRISARKTFIDRWRFTQYLKQKRSQGTF